MSNPAEIPLYQVKNWDKFQHYHDRRPPWIKLHRTVLDDCVFLRLPVASRALAPLVWLLASESGDGTFGGDIAFRLRLPELEIAEGISGLIQGGYIVCLQDASTALAPCKQEARLERETERETEREKIAVPAAKARPPQPTQRKVKLADDADWFAGIKEAYAKLGVDADAEAIRARAWLTTPKGKGRKFTQQFFANWLSRCDRNTCSGDKPPADHAARERQRTQADTAALASYADELLAIRAEEQQPDLTDERKGYITDCASRLFKKIKDTFGVEGIGKVKLLVLERNKT